MLSKPIWLAGLCLAWLTLWPVRSAIAQMPPSADEVAAYQGLFAAALADDADRIRALGAEGAEVYARDGYGRTPLHLAAYAGNHAAMRALVAAGADPDALENDRYDIVTIAAVANDLPTLEQALRLGASAANITSRYDGTALIAAAHLGHAGAVRLLIRAGAPLDHVNNLGWTALIEAIAPIRTWPMARATRRWTWPARAVSIAWSTSCAAPPPATDAAPAVSIRRALWFNGVGGRNRRPDTGTVAAARSPAGCRRRRLAHGRASARCFHRLTRLHVGVSPCRRSRSTDRFNAIGRLIMRNGCTLLFLLAWSVRSAFAVPVHDLVISEVLYDAAGGDGGLEWVELFNGLDAAVDLSGWSLGWAGRSFADASAALSGRIESGQYFVIGGPRSAARNAGPSYDRVLDFSPDLQNGGAIADGIALFDVAESAIAADTRPRFSVIYGGSNDNALRSADGRVHGPDVADAPAGASIEYLGAGAWQVQAAPSPGTGPLSLGLVRPDDGGVRVPEPSVPALCLAGVLGWWLRRQRQPA